MHMYVVILAIINISIGTRVNVTKHKIAQVQVHAVAKQVHSRPGHSIYIIVHCLPTALKKLYALIIET